MSRRKKKRKPPAEAKFQAGDRVRVRHGVSDVDYPDMPIGGWAGEITEAEDGDMYTVRWSQQTLDAMHPVFKKRCEKDGLEMEEYRLGEDDVEPDPGGPLATLCRAGRSTTHSTEAVQCLRRRQARLHQSHGVRPPGPAQHGKAGPS